MHNFIPDWTKLHSSSRRTSYAAPRGEIIVYPEFAPRQQAVSAGSRSSIVVRGADCKKKTRK